MRVDGGQTFFLNLPAHVARRNRLSVGEPILVSLLAQGIHLMPWADLRRELAS